MDYSTDYFWVVICKNHRFHHKSNTSYEHRIILGEADAFTPLPMLTEQVKVVAINAVRSIPTNRKTFCAPRCRFPKSSSRIHSSSSVTSPFHHRGTESQRNPIVAP